MRLPGSFFLRNLIERRALLWELVKRDFRQRFVGSAGGWLWSVIHPLVLLLSWTFVFHFCLRIPLRGEITDNYPLFLFTGFLPWLLFQETVNRSANSMVESANLITKTVFPSEVVPVSIYLSSLVNHAIALVLVVGAVAIWAHHFSLAVLLLPIYFLLLGLFAVGCAWIVASLQVYLRDTAQITTVLLTLWFWVTPIFISESQYPERVRFLLRINPLAYFVRAYRERLLSSRLPDPQELLFLIGVTGAVFLAGGLFFRQLKRGFADVL